MQHADRRQAAFLDPAHEDAEGFRVERLVELVDDRRREVGRIGFESNAAHQRKQDLAGVVFVAEKPFVEPLPRPFPVAERGNRSPR